MTPAIDEAPAAVAAADCLASRTARKPGRTNRHPEPCDWCDLPTALLLEWVEGYVAWMEERDEHGAPLYRHGPQAFAELARRNPAEARRLVDAARRVPAVAPAVPTPVPAPPPDPDDDLGAFA